MCTTPSNTAPMQLEELRVLSRPTIRLQCLTRCLKRLIEPVLTLQSKRRLEKRYMAVYQDTITVSTAAGRPDFIDIKQQVIDIIAASGISNGTVTCQTTHTTCSVIFEEYVHDTNWQGQEFLQGDLIRFVDKMIPREVEEDRDYRYPGPKHVQFLVDYHNEHPEFPGEANTILNGDAHLRASLFGSSQTFVVTDGMPATGEFGHIYLVDWDQNRERNRKVKVCVIGE